MDQAGVASLRHWSTEDFVIEAQRGHGVRIGPGLARIAASLSSNFTDILHPHLVALRDEVRETAAFREELRTIVGQ